MPTFADWFARSPLASAARVFIAVALSMAVADWVGNGTINLASWQTWTIAALSSALPTVLRWVNPADIEFGRGAQVVDFEPFDVWDDEETDNA